MLKGLDVSIFVDGMTKWVDPYPCYFTEVRICEIIDHMFGACIESMQETKDSTVSRVKLNAPLRKQLR